MEVSYFNCEFSGERATCRQKQEERLGMVHKRSQSALARAYIRENAFWDRQRSESVSQLSRDDAVEHLFARFKGEALQKGAVPDMLEKGLVLSDSRGEGAFQLVEET
jgi:hypothetical protein